MLSLFIASTDVAVGGLVWYTRVEGQMMRWVRHLLGMDIHLCWLKPVLLFFVSVDLIIFAPLHLTWITQLDQFVTRCNFLLNGVWFVLLQDCLYCFEVIWCAPGTSAFLPACIYLWTQCFAVLIEILKNSIWPKFNRFTFARLVCS
jgi:hypothetical protein